MSASQVTSVSKILQVTSYVAGFFPTWKSSEVISLACAKTIVSLAPVVALPPLDGLFLLLHALKQPSSIHTVSSAEKIFFM